MRIFAGPNGSGKSTIIDIVREKHIDLGIYLNADEIKVQLDSVGYLEFDKYNIHVNEKEFKDELINSSFFNPVVLSKLATEIRLEGNVLFSSDLMDNDKLSTFIADFIRSKLLGNCNKFTFETVMSHPSKLEFIKKANESGYKTYLYFVSLETHQLNIERVKARVKLNGHDVPENKIVSRYSRTMDLLFDAINIVDNAYFFDNSSSKSVLFAIYRDGEINITDPEYVPMWFHTYVLNKLS